MPIYALCKDMLERNILKQVNIDPILNIIITAGQDDPLYLSDPIFRLQFITILM